MVGFRPFGDRTTVTALEIAETVIAAVEDEPRRLNMDHFHFSASEIRDYVLDPPRCGTVACVGGWLCIVANKPTQGEHDAFRALGLHSHDVNAEGAELRECFYTFPDAVPTGRRKFAPGTPGYATAALKPFKAWVDRYRDALAARQVDIGASES